jgi:CopG family nickel-responsive transcriptional regulator
VSAFADAICAERGVHHGKLNLISVDLHQPHGAVGTRSRSAHAAPHVHLKPST